jgi:hypothetical protein
LTLKQLRSYLAKWQPRVRLEDWTITIRWATAKECEEDLKELIGLCYAYDEIKTAEILIRHPKHMEDEEDLGHRDIEITTLHELLHLHMRPFRTEEGSLLEDVEENIVHTVSTLLAALDRGDPSLLGKKLPKIAAFNKERYIVAPSISKHRDAINQTITDQEGTTQQADYTGSN